MSHVLFYHYPPAIDTQVDLSDNTGILPDGGLVERIMKHVCFLTQIYAQHPVFCHNATIDRLDFSLLVYA